MEPINKDDLGNGWYSNLPPVTVAMLQPVIAALVAAGAPANPSFETRENFRLSHDLPFGPTLLIWKQGRRTFENDAVLTYYSPSVAYVELAEKFGLPELPVGGIQLAQKPTTKVVQITDPIGDRVEGYTDRYLSAPGDNFPIGATFVDSRGRWTKARGWRAFIPYGYWSQAA